MKLLFDENLSVRLPSVLADVYPGSAHVHHCGLGSADDSSIWQYAKDNSFTIVSKDSDFQERAFSMAIRQSSSGFGQPTVPVQKSRVFCGRLSPSSSGLFRKTRNRAWCLGSAPKRSRKHLPSNQPATWYYRARYYDPSLGRFLREDPVSFTGGVRNSYQQSWLLYLGQHHSCLWYHYAFTRSDARQPESGRILPLNTHGSVVYLTAHERFLLYGLMIVGAVFGGGPSQYWQNANCLATVNEHAGRSCLVFVILGDGGLQREHADNGEFVGSDDVRVGLQEWVD